MQQFVEHQWGCAEDRCPHNHCIWLEHSHEHASHQHANEVCHNCEVWWWADQFERNVRTVWRKSRTTLLHPRESNSMLVRAWLVNSALESVESRMNCADNNHVTGLWSTVLDASWYRVDSRLVTIDGLGMLLMVWSRLCFQLSGWSMTELLSVFVTYWHVTGWRFFFCFSVPSVVLAAGFLVISWLYMDIRTSQAVDRSRRHHTLQFAFMSHRSLLVVLWKTLGSGAQFSILLPPPHSPLPSLPLPSSLPPLPPLLPPPPPPLFLPSSLLSPPPFSSLPFSSTPPSLPFFSSTSLLLLLLVWPWAVLAREPPRPPQQGGPPLRHRKGEGGRGEGGAEQVKWIGLKWFGLNRSLPFPNRHPVKLMDVQVWPSPPTEPSSKLPSVSSVSASSLPRLNSLTLSAFVLWTIRLRRNGSTWMAGSADPSISGGTNSVELLAQCAETGLVHWRTWATELTPGIVGTTRAWKQASFHLWCCLWGVQSGCGAPSWVEGGTLKLDLGEGECAQGGSASRDVGARVWTESQDRLMPSGNWDGKRRARRVSHEHGDCGSEVWSSGPEGPESKACVGNNGTRCAQRLDRKGSLTWGWCSGRRHSGGLGSPKGCGAPAHGTATSPGQLEQGVARIDRRAEENTSLALAGASGTVVAKGLVSARQLTRPMSPSWMSRGRSLHRRARDSFPTRTRDPQRGPVQQRLQKPTRQPGGAGSEQSGGSWTVGDAVVVFCGTGDSCSGWRRSPRSNGKTLSSTNGFIQNSTRSKHLITATIMKKNVTIIIVKICNYYNHNCN